MARGTLAYRTRASEDKIRERSACKILMSPSRLSNAAIVFVTPDARKTAAYYRDVLGFRIVEHYDKAEPFATLYRDTVEIVVVQAKFGSVVSNKARYGAGYDAYLDPEDVAGVDALYAELKEKGAVIESSLAMTPYGSYEFVAQDIDGRRIGIGRIKDEGVFFKDAGL
jgi:catechol 2,3-dioxygenase-like lactoylglutathione lyase family enzyme